MIQYGRVCELLIIDEDNGETKVLQGGLHSFKKESLRASFNIQKSGVALNTAEIRFYNLNDSSIKFLSKRGLMLEFSAGYVDNIAIIFKGELRNAVTEKDGVNIITTLYSSSGLTSVQTSYTNTIVNQGESTTDVVTKLLKDLTEVKIGFIDKIPECKKWIRSQTISGGTFEIIERLGRECGFSITVDDELVSIYKDDYTPRGKNVILLSKDTGLIGVPESTEIGINFTALLNPNLAPYKGVSVQSKSFRLGVSNASFYTGIVYGDGNYGIVTTNFTGDTHGSDWKASCTARYWGGEISWATQPLKK